MSVRNERLYREMKRYVEAATLAIQNGLNDEDAKTQKARGFI